MHHGLLSAIPLLVAFLGICIPLSSASATPRGGIDSATSVISRQRQQRGPQAFPLSPANRYSSPSIDHGALGKRGGIHTQELNSNFILHYHIFQAFAPDWSTASWLADFWFKLAIRLPDVPEDYFLDRVLRFHSGPLRLEVFDASGGGGYIPREFIHALASAMVGYTERGFCGMFNARVSGTGNGVGVKLWITFRVAGEVFGV